MRRVFSELERLQRKRNASLSMGTMHHGRGPVRAATKDTTNVNMPRELLSLFAIIFEFINSDKTQSRSIVKVSK